jgi:TfoX/Sxy family transcriptional regulator of competence genes
MALNAHLFDLLRDAAGHLPGVAEKRLFGCDGLFARDNIFGLIWKTGRIGLKLTTPADFDTLMAMPGAEPWAPRHPMSHWVLVPESFHDDEEALALWARKAHAQALDAPPKAAKPAKKPAAKKPAAKKPAAKKPAPKKPARARG